MSSRRARLLSPKLRRRKVSAGGIKMPIDSVSRRLHQSKAHVVITIVTKESKLLTNTKPDRQFSMQFGISLNRDENLIRSLVSHNQKDSAQLSACNFISIYNVDIVSWYSCKYFIFISRQHQEFPFKRRLVWLVKFRLLFCCQADSDPIIILSSEVQFAVKLLIYQVQ